MMKLIGLLALLPTFHGATEASTVTLARTTNGLDIYSEFYPWPAIGRFTLSQTCSSRVVTLRLASNRGKWSAYVTWDLIQSKITINCWFGVDYEHAEPADCSGGNITYNVEVRRFTFPKVT